MESTDTTQIAPKPRIQSLSDLIFGLALSLGAITLVGNVQNLTIDQVRSAVIIFGLSFLILISVWIRYTKITSVLPLENRSMITLNTTLLFTVSIEPFFFNLMQLNNVIDKNLTSQYYALDLGVMMLILSGFTITASRQPKLLRENSHELRLDGITLFIAGTLFFASTSNIFWNSSMQTGGLQYRFILWILPFSIAALRRRGSAALARIRKRRAKKSINKQPSK